MQETRGEEKYKFITGHIISRRSKKAAIYYY